MTIFWNTWIHGESDTLKRSIDNNPLGLPEEAFGFVFGFGTKAQALIYLKDPPSSISTMKNRGHLGIIYIVTSLSGRVEPEHDLCLTNATA